MGPGADVEREVMETGREEDVQQTSDTKIWSESADTTFIFGEPCGTLLARDRILKLTIAPFHTESRTQGWG